MKYKINVINLESERLQRPKTDFQLVKYSVLIKMISERNKLQTRKYKIGYLHYPIFKRISFYFEI